MCHDLRPRDRDAEQAAANPSLNLESIHPNYFETFEVPLVRGRAFAATDREGAVEVAIVSEDVAARLWPGEDPIGKRLKMGGLASTGAPGTRSLASQATPDTARWWARGRRSIFLPRSFK